MYLGDGLRVEGELENDVTARCLSDNPHWGKEIRNRLFSMSSPLSLLPRIGPLLVVPVTTHSPHWVGMAYLCVSLTRP